MKNIFSGNIARYRKENKLTQSGELFTHFHDWYIEQCSEYVFDCNSSGTPHKHAANRLFARKIKTL
jgi:hypothetical protein